MTEAEIKAEIASLERQQQQGRQMAEQGRQVVEQTEGALRLARHWLGKLQRKEDEQNSNGQVEHELARCRD